MKLIDFIDTYISPNSSLILRNKNMECMKCILGKISKSTKIMDWYIKYSNIQNANVLKICAIEGSYLCIDLDIENLDYLILPDLVTLENSPFWFYNESHNT